MKKKLLLTAIFITTLISTYAQTISNVKVSHDTFCPGSKVDVTFTIEGTFGTANTFTAQLSNEAGNFNTFTNIPSQNTGTSLTVTIPNIVHSSLYRIRIISTSPFILSPDNASNLTLKTAPSPSYTLEVEGTEVKDRQITYALVNQPVIFNNTTNDVSLCEWTFGDDASIKSYIGCSPPSIAFQKEGSKTIRLKVTEGVCTGESNVDINYLQIVSCSPLIPEKVIVARSGENSGGFADGILICPGASFTPVGSIGKVFVEPGGTYRSAIYADPFIYLKAGSSGQFEVRSSPTGSPLGNIAYDINASINGNVDQKLLCPTITFDYSLVKCKCDEDCNITDINKVSSNDKLSLFPNPTQGNIVFHGIDDKFTLSIYNVQGNIISENIYNSNSINLSELTAGFYTVKVTDSNGTRMEKLIVSK